MAPRYLFLGVNQDEVATVAHDLAHHADQPVFQSFQFNFQHALERRLPCGPDPATHAVLAQQHDEGEEGVSKPLASLDWVR